LGSCWGSPLSLTLVNPRAVLVNTRGSTPP
jgi:hypothetical protein